MYVYNALKMKLISWCWVIMYEICSQCVYTVKYTLTHSEYYKILSWICCCRCCRCLRHRCRLACIGISPLFISFNLLFFKWRLLFQLYRAVVWCIFNASKLYITFNLSFSLSHFIAKHTHARAHIKRENLIMECDKNFRMIKTKLLFSQLRQWNGRMERLCCVDMNLMGWSRAREIEGEYSEKKRQQIK